MKDEADLFIGAFLIITGVSYLLFRGKNRSSDSKTARIFRRLGLVAEIKTDIPIMAGKEQKKDKYGRKMFEEEEHIPEADLSGLPKSFIIRKVHPTKEASVTNYLNGILHEFHKEGLIPHDSGNVQKTGLIQGEFIVHLHDRKKLEEMDMFRKIRWMKEEIVNGITKAYYPEYRMTEKEVIVDIPEALKTLNNETIQRGIETFSKHIGKALKPTFERSKDASQIFFMYQKPLNRYFNFGDMIVNKWDAWVENIVKPMRDHYAKKGVELTFLGELEDATRTLPNTQIFVPLTSYPHFMVVGQTRSGKTKSILSQVVTHACAYPKSEFLFADGKSSPDYDMVAKMFSRFPVAKLNKGDDPLIELANVVFYALRRYEQNQKKLEDVAKKGFACANYIDYNTFIKLDTSLTEEQKEELYIRRFFLYIDEFAEFISMVNVEKLVNTKDSIFWAIGKLLRASASAGFTIIIASQRYQNSDFPTSIRSNLTNWMIHMINIRDAQGIQMEEDVGKLKSGSYVLKASGIQCEDSNHPHLQCTMPFIGEGMEIQKTVERIMAGEIDPETGEARYARDEYPKEDFNIDLVYNQGDDDDIEKVSPSYLSKNIKQVFLKREGYEILWEGNPEIDYVSTVAMDREGEYYSISVVDAKDVEDSGFINKLTKTTSPHFAKSRKVIFVQGVLRKALDIQQYLTDRIGKVYIIRDIDFVRPMKRALACYQTNDETPIFKTMLDLEAVEGSDASDLYDVPEQDEEINHDKLASICAISNPKQKGDAFEAWYLSLERKLGYDAVPARSIINEGIIEDIFANPQAEGGFDIIRWVDKENKKAIGIQCKNQQSRAVDIEIINKAVKSRLLYTNMGVEIVDTLVVTTGKFTKQAVNEAGQLGIKLINAEILAKLIDEVQERINPSVRIKRENSGKKGKGKQIGILNKDQKVATSNEEEVIGNLGEVLDYDIDDIDFLDIDNDYDDTEGDELELDTQFRGQFSDLDDDKDEGDDLDEVIEITLSDIDFDKLTKNLKQNK